MIGIHEDIPQSEDKKIDAKDMEGLHEQLQALGEKISAAAELKAGSEIIHFSANDIDVLLEILKHQIPEEKESIVPVDTQKKTSISFAATPKGLQTVSALTGSAIIGMLLGGPISALTAGIVGLLIGAFAEITERGGKEP